MLLGNNLKLKKLFALFLDQFHSQLDSQIILTEVNITFTYTFLHIYIIYTHTHIHKVSLVWNVSNVISQLCAGFESVTYMLQGGIIHKDPRGHKGTIQAGDVQVKTIQNTHTQKNIEFSLSFLVSLNFNFDLTVDDSRKRNHSFRVSGRRSQ